jgi:hypothetical protein
LSLIDWFGFLKIFVNKVRIVAPRYKKYCLTKTWNNKMFEGKVFIGVVQLRYFKFHYQMPTLFS